MTPRSREVVQAELTAAKAELKRLRAQRAEIETCIQALEGGWGGEGKIQSIVGELEDAGKPTVAYTETRFGEERTTYYAILSLTAKQAKVREYGEPNRHTHLIRSGESYPATLEVCRAAWAAAGYIVPK